MKTCNKCNQEKPESEFYVWKDGRIYSSCKPCWNKNRNMRSRMKAAWSMLTPSHCECCGVKSDSLNIEHSHDPYHFRGFTCQSCNVTLAYLGDTYESVMDSDCDQIYKDYMQLARYRTGETL